MNRIITFLLLLTLSASAVHAQDGESEKVRERMTEYIQKKLGMSRTEADRFGPVFLDYFKELRNTNQQYKGDRLLLQQKVVELRLRYRDQFKPIIGEKRSNDVFNYEREFVDEARRLLQERKGDRPPGRGNQSLNPRL